MERIRFILARMKWLHPESIKDTFYFPIGTSIWRICVESWLCTSMWEFKRVRDSVRLDWVSIKDWFEYDEDKDRILEKECFHIFIGKIPVNLKLIYVWHIKKIKIPLVKKVKLYLKQLLWEREKE